MILSANKICDLFMFEPNKNKLFFVCNDNEEIRWHARYGHLNFASLHELSNNKMIRGMNVNIPANRKIVSYVFPTNATSGHTASLIGVHQRFWNCSTLMCVGPLGMNRQVGKYLLTYIDDKARFIFVYFLKHKHESEC